tara:strand:+ start:133 stop:2478 length:2346 start_codon:yes stop_codon:yes gene_type:complete
MKTKLHLLFFALLFSVGLHSQDNHSVELVGGTPSDVVTQSLMSFDVNYTLDTNAPSPSKIIVRFRTEADDNLGFKIIDVTTGSGTLTIDDVPTPNDVGADFKLQVQLYKPDYSNLAQVIYTPINVIAKPVKATYLFSVNADSEGWVKEPQPSSGTEITVLDGVMKVKRSWGPTNFQQRTYKLDPSIHSHIHITYKNLSWANDRLFATWTTSGLTKSAGIYIPINTSSATYETVSYDLSALGVDWTAAEANLFRLEVQDASNTNFVPQGDEFLIQSIVFNNSATPDNIFSQEVDNDWANAANWSLNTAPVPTSAIVIPADKGIDVTNLNVDPAGSFIIESGGSLKVSGTASGNVTYNRTVDFVDGDLKGWFLMGAPVASQDYDDSFVTANDIAVKGSNRGISTYNTTTDNWVYHQGATSDTFAAGTGYSVKRGSSSGTVSFTGTVNVDDAGVSVPLSNTGSRFNLLGNPYTAYLSSATFLDNEAGISDSKTMWVYNKNLGTNGQYEPKTVGQNFIIAPGQGFFVQANAVTPGSFNFSEANQSHNGTDTFQKTANVQGEITLSMTDGTINNYGKVYYVNKATKSLDIGYEGELFSGQTNDFAIYTHLVSNNVGKKYQVQSLPNSDYENMIVPVGIKAAAGKEITISATSLNLPENIKVYLEDRAMNVVTDLNNTDYKITLNSALDGVGRFFLRTSASSVLSTETNTLSGISIYKTNNATLKIVGLQQGASNVKLFNILGKQILNNSFEATGAKEISLPKLATGVYIVQLETAAGKLNKKIILE